MTKGEIALKLAIAAIDRMPESERGRLLTGSRIAVFYNDIYESLIPTVPDRQKDLKKLSKDEISDIFDNYRRNNI